MAGRGNREMDADFYSPNARFCKVCSDREGRSIWHLPPLCTFPTPAPSTDNEVKFCIHCRQELFESREGGWLHNRRGGDQAYCHLTAAPAPSTTDEVTAALNELREMFPPENTMNISCSVQVGFTFWHGKTLDEAMQKVRKSKAAARAREWKESQGK